MDQRKDEDEVRSVHSSQLRFARNRVPIGEGVSFLKIKALRDFQILQRSITTLDKWGCWLWANECSSSRMKNQDE